ncbi:recombinase RecF [Rubrivivax gelatinosus]|nr:recombinase RecF [Rubrivivax gelatinosus]
MTQDHLDPSAIDLVSIELARFKAVFKSRPVTLKPFNAVIGRNGSGKSTLIEALQWMDATLRRDAVEACKRYSGIHDLLNLRSQAAPAYFEVKSAWKIQDKSWKYHLKVQEDPLDGRTPLITGERLYRKLRSGLSTEISEPESSDRLTLSRPPSAAKNATLLKAFWKNAVFLRLSPAGLAEGSLARRSTTDPLLDEQGRNLPALLNELTIAQKQDLVQLVKSVLNDIENITVSGNTKGRNETVHYELHERMPYQGRTGKTLFPIPAWMLSEGTRRITAIFALLVHDPAPSLLCIEEVENGLDPWSVIRVLSHLQSAASSRGIQVIITTHSPWVLDHVPLDSIIHVQRESGSTVYSRFCEMPNVQRYAPDIPAGTRYIEEGLAGPVGVHRV